MYGNPPEAVDWDGIEHDETGLFDDVGDEATEDSCFSPAVKPTGFLFAQARTQSAWSPFRSGGSIAADGSAGNIRQPAGSF